MSAREIAFDFFSSCPLCLVALDPTSGRPIQVNETFEQYMGPFFKFQGYKFADAATGGEKHQDRLADAIQTIVEGSHAGCPNNKITLRNIEMVTLAGNAGLPIRRHFDWTISMSKDGCVLLFGEQCTEVDIEQRAKDSELIDFFQNAPIALHWLSGTGDVIWANQTELDVLGYTKEEYIGKPIMNFCPDDEELVLEIFQQLGSGNAIRDVPVRFRTKNGNIVNLLIDSNVKYDIEGNFAHTRCFIRDDTGRKIREARAQLLLEETKRSLRLIDNFMSRSMHHIKTALHVLQHMCDCVSTNLHNRINSGSMNTEDMENMSLLQDSTDHIFEVNTMIQDIMDLERFDQGHEFELKLGQVDLKSFGLTVVAKTPNAPENVEVALDLTGGGPAIIESDAVVLTRILHRLMENAVQATKRGHVTLRIGYSDGRCTFTVVDSGPGLSSGGSEEIKDGNLPAIFQRYHQQIIPEEILDINEATDLRQRIEDGINSHRKNGLGIGLAASYHLVLALGSDLRFSSRPGETVFSFSLPLKASTNVTTAPLDSQRIVKVISMASPSPEPILKLPTPASSGDQPMVDVRKIPPANDEIAPENLIPKRDFSVLVVEDTNSAAKLLCMMLKKLECTSTRAEHGQEALDILNKATPGTYNLILMDLRMPVMDGLEATKIIKNEMKLSVPVVALTAEMGAEIEKECEAIGFDGFYTKPLRRIKLKGLIEKHKSSTAYLQAGGVSLDRHTKICASTNIENLLNQKCKISYQDLATSPVPKKMIASNGLKAMEKSSILVVEDTDTAAKLLCMMLAKLNCSSFRAENGKRAIDILRDAMPGMYNLILMDIRMPVMDGLEATRIIKEVLKLDIPVVAITGDTGAETQRKCEEIGFDGFCMKPLNIPQLNSIIQKHTLCA